MCKMLWQLGTVAFGILAAQTAALSADAATEPAVQRLVIRLRAPAGESPDWRCAVVRADRIVRGLKSDQVVRLEGMHCKVDPTGAAIIELPALTLPDVRCELVVTVAAHPKCPYRGQLTARLDPHETAVSRPSLELTLAKAVDVPLVLRVVRGPASRPLPDEVVIVQTADGGASDQQKTDANGLVTFNVDPARPYRVSSGRRTGAAGAFEEVTVPPEQLTNRMGPIVLRVPDPVLVLRVRIKRGDTLSPLDLADGYLHLLGKAADGLYEYAAVPDGTDYVLYSLRPGAYTVEFRDPHLKKLVPISGLRFDYPLADGGQAHVHEIVVREE